MNLNPTCVVDAWRSAALAVLLLVLAVMLSPADPALAEEPRAADLDPVVAEILEMLDAGVDEGVILQWLESTGRCPVDVGSQGLIALNDAEGSAEFVKTLLTLVEEQGVEDPGMTAPPPAARFRAAEPISAGAQPVTQDTVEAVIRLRAKRVWVDEDEPDRPRDPPWNIFLYLDGEFVAWTWPTLQGVPAEARRVIPAGPREMRVVLQRYEALRGGWLYESLSVPTRIGFEARGGDPIEIDVEMKRIWGLWRQRRNGGPLSYFIRQGDEILAEEGGTGGDPNRWQPVCEDVEANFLDSETVPKRWRSSMSRCIRWADLWTVSGPAESREEILRSLAEDNFQPAVR